MGADILLNDELSMFKEQSLIGSDQYEFDNQSKKCENGFNQKMRNDKKILKILQDEDIINNTTINDDDDEDDEYEGKAVTQK